MFRLYKCIHTTHPANSIETTDMVQQIQQFKLLSSMFQVSMQLYIEYLQITDQTLHNLSPTVQTFQLQMSAAYMSLSI